MTNGTLSTEIDFIGDIHGHADELKELFERELKYKKHNGYYYHPTRKAFFVGDFIDRGPFILEVLEIVRAMIDNGAAHAVIGNHEYNAICYWTKGPNGVPLRPHVEKNIEQHKRTIESVNNVDLLLEYVEWFKTLPIYFESEHFRVVHAQWKHGFVQRLKEWGVINFSDPIFLENSSQQGKQEFSIIDCLLKGEEIRIPGAWFEDKGGNKRDHYRVKWWMRGDNLTYKRSLFEFAEEADDGVLAEWFSGYEESNVPVFFGHYWLKDVNPRLQKPNVCCVDFSVAKEGMLTAYCWDGERELDETKFKYVKTSKMKN